MGQTLLKDHIPSPAIDLCSNCLNPITPYWVVAKIEPTTGDKIIITSKKECEKCGAVIEEINEIYHPGGCFKCSEGCNHSHKGFSLPMISPS